jgi:steroid delta-isomerase-like uncharacterized protein
MSTEDNKAIIRRQYEEAINEQKLDLLDELIGPDYVSHDPTLPEPIRGVEGLKEYAGGYFTAFPDLQFTIEEQIAEGDTVVTRWTARGTHEGELFGIAPTGKRTTTTGVSIERLADGKIVESHDQWDALGLMQQLGVAPALTEA